MTGKNKEEKGVKIKVPPRFELGLLDSESNVLTARPWNHFVHFLIKNFILINYSISKFAPIELAAGSGRLTLDFFGWISCRIVQVYASNSTPLQ